MSTWVSIKRVSRFPQVLQTYRTASGFFDAVRAALKAGSAWVRLPPSDTNVSWQDSQIDVAAIPGVAALRASGRKV